MKRLISESELQQYDTWIKQSADGTLWQSLERKTYLDALGKETRIYALTEGEQILASALVVIDGTSMGITVWDIPRGPIGERREELLQKIIDQAKEESVTTLYYSPIKNLSLPMKVKTSKRHIHADATRILDLTQSEEEILEDMKQKGRYNIRVAEKNNVTVKQSEDIDAFYALIEETSGRDQFTALQKEKYRAFLTDLSGSFLFLAYDEKGAAIAGLIGVIWNNSAIYYYGASSYAHRALMAPYALQWEAIRHCKAQGASSYDLLGIAPSNASNDHPWKGITRFKEQFGGKVIEYPQEQMIVLQPWKWRVLMWKRKIFG